MPLTTGSVRVPPSIAPPGLFASAMLTVPPMAAFPRLSWTRTVRPNVLPAGMLDGGSVWMEIWLGNP